LQHFTLTNNLPRLQQACPIFNIMLPAEHASPNTQITTNNYPITVPMAGMTHPAHQTSVRYFFAPVQVTGK
jgi:hypothetical protein